MLVYTFRENDVHIFYCAGGKFGEVAEVFLTENHRTLAVEAPDAEAVRPVCCGARVKHRTVNTGRRVAPVRASGAV